MKEMVLRDPYKSSNYVAVIFDFYSFASASDGRGSDSNQNTSGKGGIRRLIPNSGYLVLRRSASAGTEFSSHVIADSLTNSFGKDLLNTITFNILRVYSHG